MNKFLFILFFYLSAIVDAPGQGKNNVKLSKGEAVVKQESSMSELETRKVALQRAKIDAIRNAFGEQVYLTTSSNIRHQSIGDNTSSQVIVNSVMDTQVNGLWVEDVGVPEFTKRYIDDEVWINCFVKGKVKGINNTKVALEAYPLNQPAKRSKTFDFQNNEDFYFYFRSAEDGYISVFLDDGNICQRVLPYVSWSQNYYEIKAGQDYLFFSKQNEADPGRRHLVNTLSLFTKEEREFNRIYLLYGKKPFGSLLMEKEFNKKQFDKTSTEDYALYPDGILSNAFHQWLSSLMVTTEDVQVEIIDITITK